MTPRTAVPLWRDVRFWRIFSQAVFLAALAALIWFFLANMQRNMARQGLKLGFGFLSDPASFAIGESAIDFNPSHSYARAFLAGLVNTLKVAVAGIALATPLGVVLGVLRLSGNWLVNKLVTGYVEILRNTPLLVQMVFWYSAVFLNLPPVKEQVALPGPVYLNNRGVAIPWVERHATFGTWALVLLAAAVAAVALWRWQLRRLVETGRDGYPSLLALGLFFGAGALAWYALPQAPLQVLRPVLQGTNIQGGAQLSPEFAAVLFALVTYTSAFISEIVRSGIQSVSRGQVEAARALGLRPLQTLRLVVFPQAMRVIVPPLTSQFLNLTKNSSLAIGVGYPDLFNVSTTIFNQTGRNVEVFLMVMAVYGSFSLITSALMNWYNRSIRLVER